MKKAAILPKDKPVVVACSVSERSSIAISLLKKQGFSKVLNMLGGMTAWKNLGYPIKKGLFRFLFLGPLMFLLSVLCCL
jgi:rhodanese-related sulfurtransferase